MPCRGLLSQLDILTNFKVTFSMLMRMFRCLLFRLKLMNINTAQTHEKTCDKIWTKYKMWVSQYYFSKQREMQTPAATEALLQNEIPKYPQYLDKKLKSCTHNI